MAMPVWLREKLFLKDLLVKELAKLDGGGKTIEPKIVFTEHHLSHAASAYFPSPFEEAVVLTMDGVGEWATTSTAYGRGDLLEMRKEIHFPQSLGLLIPRSHITGIQGDTGEYKECGWRRTARHLCAGDLDNIIRKAGRLFRLNLDTSITAPG